jgi:hypothetical protein
MNSPVVGDEPIATSFALRDDGNDDIAKRGRTRRAIENGPFEASNGRRDDDNNADNSRRRQLSADRSTNIVRPDNRRPCYNEFPMSNPSSTAGLLPPHPSDLLADVSINHVDNDDNPDESSTVANYGFEYLKYYQEDLFWSFLSDVCFLTGSLLYITVSYIEVQHNDGTNKPRCYNIIVVLAPLLYLQNSLVDIQFALMLQRRKKYLRRHGTADRMTTAGLLRDDNTTAGRLPPPRGSPSSGTTSQRTTTSGNVVGSVAPEGSQQPQHMVPSSSSCSSAWWRRLFRYAAHRRTLYAAGTFGLAALLSVVAVLLEYDPVSQKVQQATYTLDDEENEDDESISTSDKFYTASGYVYVISAAIALTGRRVRPWFNHTSAGVAMSPEILYAMLQEPEALEDMGDILFLLGSVFDAFLDNLAVEAVPMLGALSSLLWFVDALLYLQSDFVMARRLRNREMMSDPLVVSEQDFP